MKNYIRWRGITLLPAKVIFWQTYGTGQRKFDSHEYITHVFLLLHMPAFACASTHAHQSITVTGNDTGYSPPSSVLHAG